MNSRERVLKTFGRLPGKADRVPVQFEMCRQLRDHFSEEPGIPAHYTENLYEDFTCRIEIVLATTLANYCGSLRY